MVWCAAVCIVTLMTGITVRAQTVENINTKFDGEKIVITYDLNYSNPTEKFNVDLYSSHDNYTRPLTLVTGAAGENVIAGKANRVVWDAKNTLPPDFDGEITIRIKVSRVVIPPLEVTPLSTTVYKRGRNIALNWAGGLPNEKLIIDLYQNNVPAQRVAEQMDNSGAYNWKLPKNVKGKNYDLRVRAVDRPDDLAVSQVFRVKPRTPFIVKVLPLLAVGVAVMVLGGDSGGGDSGGGVDAVLPGPVRPGG